MKLYLFASISRVVQCQKKNNMALLNKKGLGIMRYVVPNLITRKC